MGLVIALLIFIEDIEIEVALNPAICERDETGEEGAFQLGRECLNL